MTLIFAFAAGLLTLINPCVLPVLPIVLASALQASRFGPIALTAGMAIGFVALGLGIAALGQSIGLSTERVGEIGALLMVGFGAILLVPRLNAGFTLATAGLATQADRGIGRLDTSLWSQALGGALLGAVWSPCIGPTLGGAIALASQGRNLPYAAAIMASFAAGVATVMLTLAYAARATLRQTLRQIAERTKPFLGLIFAATGAALYFHLDRYAEIWALDHLPYWLQDFSVSL